MSDYFDIRSSVEARRRAEEEALGIEAPKKGLTPRFVRECLAANELGDGTLFAFLNRDKFIFNKTSGRWYRWTGHHWEMDVTEKVFEAVESVVLAYLEEADRILSDGKGNVHSEEEYERFLRRARRLRTMNGAKACLTWAHCIKDGLGIKDEEFDRRAWLLACRNGVVELRTGRFRAGRPDDYLVKAVPHEWVDIDHPAPMWERFLKDVFAGDEELISYIQRLFGYGITGLATEHIMPVLYGTGRNGKSTLVETLKFVLGDLARPIQSEMLLDQRNARNSAGPSPDIMGLKGLRIAFASEVDEGRRFSASRAKWLSGGDTLMGRNPHDKYETTFVPTHLLCLLTNHLPHASGDDFAFWQRIHLVPFNVSFVDNPSAENERPRDKDLLRKLKLEASGILAWLVRGCLEWQRRGLDPPRPVLAATAKYRASEDLIAEFIEACCYPPEETDPDERTQFKELYNAFEAWFVANIGDQKHVPKKKRFGALMEKRFRREKAGGHIWFYGISLRGCEGME